MRRFGREHQCEQATLSVDGLKKRISETTPDAPQFVVGGFRGWGLRSAGRSEGTGASASSGAAALFDIAFRHPEQPSIVQYDLHPRAKLR